MRLWCPFLVGCIVVQQSVAHRISVSNNLDSSLFESAEEQIKSCEQLQASFNSLLDESNDGVGAMIESSDSSAKSSPSKRGQMKFFLKMRKLVRVVQAAKKKPCAWASSESNVHEEKIAPLFAKFAKLSPCFEASTQVFNSAVDVPEEEQHQVKIRALTLLFSEDCDLDEVIDKERSPEVTEDMHENAQSAQVDEELTEFEKDLESEELDDASLLEQLSSVAEDESLEFSEQDSDASIHEAFSNVSMLTSPLKVGDKVQVEVYSWVGVKRRVTYQNGKVTKDLGSRDAFVRMKHAFGMEDCPTMLMMTTGYRGEQNINECKNACDQHEGCTAFNIKTTGMFCKLKRCQGGVLPTWNGNGWDGVAKRRVPHYEVQFGKTTLTLPQTRLRWGINKVEVGQAVAVKCRNIRGRVCNGVGMRLGKITGKVNNITKFGFTERDYWKVEFEGGVTVLLPSRKFILVDNKNDLVYTSGIRLGWISFMVIPYFWVIGLVLLMVTMIPTALCFATGLATTPITMLYCSIVGGIRKSTSKDYSFRHDCAWFSWLPKCGVVAKSIDWFWCWGDYSKTMRPSGCMSYDSATIRKAAVVNTTITRSVLGSQPAVRTGVSAGARPMQQPPGVYRPPAGYQQPPAGYQPYPQGYQQPPAGYQPYPAANQYGAR